MFLLKCFSQAEKAGAEIKEIAEYFRVASLDMVIRKDLIKENAFIAGHGIAEQ